MKRFNCIETCDKKWIEITDLSSGQYSANKYIRFKNSVLRSDLCDCSNAYIAFKGRISVTSTNAAIKRNRKLTFKNNSPFRSCISKINNTFVDNAEDLNIDLNLLEYGDNFSMKSGNLWNYYRDEANDSANEIDDNDNKINSDKVTASESLEYKTKIVGSKPNHNSRLNAEVVISLKYLSNFWRSLDLPFINCEIELDVVKILCNI